MEEKKESGFLKKFKTAIKKREVIVAMIITAVIGLIIGMVLMFFVHPTQLAKFKHGDETIATFAEQSISSKELYDLMKQHYSIELILENIDRKVLNGLYTLDADMKAEVSKNADSFIAYYQAYYGYTEEQIYDAFGFESREELESYLQLDYKRSLYLYDYVEKKLEDGAVEKYYEENKESLTKYDSKHILVKTSDTVTDEQALATAKEIITKLDEGKTYEDIVVEYGDKVTAEILGYYGDDGSLEEGYIKALIALEDGAYSKEPAKTSFGYHIIFRLGTSTMKDVRKEILDVLSNDMFEKDKNLAYNVLIEMRKEANITFYDEDLNNKYKEYCEKYVVEETTTDNNTNTNTTTNNNTGDNSNTNEDTNTNTAD